MPWQGTKGLLECKVSVPLQNPLAGHVTVKSQTGVKAEIDSDDRVTYCHERFNEDVMGLGRPTWSTQELPLFKRTICWRGSKRVLNVREIFLFLSFSTFTFIILYQLLRTNHLDIGNSLVVMIDRKISDIQWRPSLRLPSQQLSSIFPNSHSTRLSSTPWLTALAENSKAKASLYLRKVETAAYIVLKSSQLSWSDFRRDNNHNTGSMTDAITRGLANVQYVGRLSRRDLIGA